MATIIFHIFVSCIVVKRIVLISNKDGQVTLAASRAVHVNSIHWIFHILLAAKRARPTQKTSQRNSFTSFANESIYNEDDYETYC